MENGSPNARIASRPTRAGPRANRIPTALGALVFFGLATLFIHLAQPLLQALHLERLEPMVLGTLIYAPFIVVPLAYAFSPRIFTGPYWHIPGNSWIWITAFSMVRAFGVAYGTHQPSIPLPFAFGIVFISPITEEIVKAVMICPLVDRWGTFLGIAVTSLLTALVHPQPWRALIPTVALSVMFVATRRSIAATTLAHSILNAIVVAGSRIQGA